MSQIARALREAHLDLLLLGGLADRLRKAERGDVVRLWFDAPEGEACTFGAEARAEASDGHAFVRRIAEARLSGPLGGAIRIDVEAVGLPLAQVALAFGADEWVVPRKLSLRVYGEGDADAERLALLRERELVTLVRGAGRTPRIVERRDREVVERDPDETTPATRKFRAPGREVRALERAPRTDTDDMEERR